ncbi:MAG: amino acid racemase [Pseudomonadota bacterium]
MSLIGLIGGVSPEATQIYYRLLNAHVRAEKGGQHSATLLFYMLDYGDMVGHYHERDWAAFNAKVVSGAQTLKSGGATAIAITSGTTHVAAEAVAAETGLPVIHMLDSLTAALNLAGVERPLLLGTPWVMSGEFFGPALAKRYGGAAIVPRAEDRDTIGRIIFDELVEGVVDEGSRRALIELVVRYATEGADGVILGCTELCMILTDGDGDVPIFSTTHIHAAAIDQWAKRVGKPPHLP